MTAAGRAALAAGVVIAFALGAALLVLWWTGGAPPGAASSPRPEAPEPGAARPDRAASGGAAPVALPAVPAPPPRAPTQREALPPWSEVPVSARLSALGPLLARPVYDGLQEARRAMSPCFAAAADESARRAAARTAPDEDAWGAAVVLLQLETGRDEIVVTGAALQNLGDSPPSLVDCCEGVLRGLRIAAPGATPGRRFRLPYQLTE